MNRLGYLGTLGKKIAATKKEPIVAAPISEQPTSTTLELQVVEVPIVLPEPIQIVEVPTIEPVIEVPPIIQFQGEELCASLPVLASIVSSHTESFSE